MRIAILSSSQFSVAGGAERLFIDLARALDADIITPSFDENVVRNYDSAKGVRMISLNASLPGEPWRQIAGMRLFAGVKLDYDFIIPTDDMAVRALGHHTPHFYYMLTPRRAMYDMYYPFLEECGTISRIGYFGALNTFRFLDRRFVKHHVNNIACISHTVRNRIFKAYQRDSGVIYPAVHMDNYSDKASEGYWLSVGRVDKWKRIPLQVETFRQMPDKKLLIAGYIYPRFESVVKNAPENVTFLGPCDESRLIDLYSRCEGFITTAIDEDFGITPVEAMASGKPVVATKEGGYLETVADGSCGILTSPDPASLCRAVRVIASDPSVYTDACLKRARLFDYPSFRSAAGEYLWSCIKE